MNTTWDDFYYCDWKDTKHIFSSLKTEKFITANEKFASVKGECEI